MSRYSSNHDRKQPGRPPLLYLVYFISFFCGMTQCFESVFLPEFREYFHLSYQQQMYMVFAKNLPFLLAFAVGLMVQRVGYKNCLTIAMLFYAAGTLLLVPGLRAGDYAVVLAGFVVIGSGFSIHMVAGNPLLGALGPANGTSSRLNLGNALGAVAQIVSPAALAFIVPTSAILAQEKLPYIETLFVVLGVALVGLAGITMFFKDATGYRKRADEKGIAAPQTNDTVWRYPRVIFGFVTIFLVLGVEAALFSFFRNYLEDPDIVRMTSHQSQLLFTIYFALFAAGRLLASWIQKRINPKTHLQYHLFAALACLAVIILAKGTVAVVALLAIGFFASIFFPTLYALAMANLGDLTGQASGLLTLGFLGCAVLPVLQGRLADSFGLQRSFSLGLFVYAFAISYTFWGLRSKDANGKPSVEAIATSPL